MSIIGWDCVCGGGFRVSPDLQGSQSRPIMLPQAKTQFLPIHSITTLTQMILLLCYGRSWNGQAICLRGINGWGITVCEKDVVRPFINE